MKDSRIGTYALVGMLLVLHMKLHALAAFEATSVGAVLVAAHCASRWTSVPLLYCCKYIQVHTTYGQDSCCCCCQRPHHAKIFVRQLHP